PAQPSAPYLRLRAPPNPPPALGRSPHPRFGPAHGARPVAPRRRLAPARQPHHRAPARRLGPAPSPARVSRGDLSLGQAPPRHGHLALALPQRLCPHLPRTRPAPAAHGRRDPAPPGLDRPSRGLHRMETASACRNPAPLPRAALAGRSHCRRPRPLALGAAAAHRLPAGRQRRAALAALDAPAIVGLAPARLGQRRSPQSPGGRTALAPLAGDGRPRLAPPLGVPRRQRAALSWLPARPLPARSRRPAPAPLAALPQRRFAPRPARRGNRGAGGEKLPLAGAEHPSLNHHADPLPRPRLPAARQQRPAHAHLVLPARSARRRLPHHPGLLARHRRPARPRRPAPSL